jgi:hypothetical protein
MKKEESNCTLKKLKSGHLLQRGPDTKTNWPTERRSQYNLNIFAQSGLVENCCRLTATAREPRGRERQLLEAVTG